ncbi:hypothetical protein Tco_0078149 [Tanacetum coccineum]
MAISVISVSSDSLEDNVGTPAGRVILFGIIPTTIPDTTTVITPPTTQTDTIVIPTKTPIISPTIPLSQDYTPTSPDYSPAFDSESDPSEDPSSDHILPLPAISLVCNRYLRKGQNQSQNDKTEHENGKTVRSQKDKVKVNLGKWHWKKASKTKPTKPKLCFDLSLLGKKLLWKAYIGVRASWEALGLVLDVKYLPKAKDLLVDQEPNTHHFLSSADDTTKSDTPDTPPSPTHGTPFTEITSSTQRSPVIPRHRVMILAPGQPIPHGRSYRYHDDCEEEGWTVTCLATCCRHTVESFFIIYFSPDDSTRDSSPYSSSEAFIRFFSY